VNNEPTVFPGQENFRVTSFGAQLKQEREKQGVTLEQISVSTKIGTRMLRALEEEHFDQLPGGIFNKGFIRAYARCLHMDEDQAVADYLAATGASPPAKNSETNDQAPILEPPSREQSDAATGLPWSTFAVVLLIIALGFAAWGFYSRESQKTTPDSTPPAANSPNISPPATAEQSPPQPKPAESIVSSTTAKPTQRTATPATGESTPSQSASATASTSTSTQLKPPVPATAPLLVLIKAREDSWLSISVDGEIITRALLSAPAQKSVRAEKEIVIKAGNVGALDFEFNGKKLPSQGDYGEVKTLTFDAHGLQPPAPKPAAPAQLP
jgi:cytoskeleton protein RodZ